MFLIVFWHLYALFDRTLEGQESGAANGPGRIRTQGRCGKDIALTASYFTAHRLCDTQNGDGNGRRKEETE